MTYYVVGDTVAVAISVTDSSGAAADPGTGPTATVYLPDGTSTAGTVTKTSTGNFTCTYQATTAGRHRIVWTASGANSSGFPHTEALDVWPVNDRAIISLDDARDALNIATTSRTQDEELRLYIAAATEIIEDIAGPVLSASVSEAHSGSGKFGFPLWHKASAITSVTEDGTALVDGTDFAFDAVSNVLWRGSQPGAGAWSDASPGNVSVAYTVGSGVVPPNIVLAARELVRHLYAIGQQPWRTPYGGGLDDVMMTTTPSGYAVPNRVVELLKPSMAGRMPGFA